MSLYQYKPMVYPHPEKVHERTAEMTASGITRQREICYFHYKTLELLIEQKNIISLVEDSRGIKLIVFQNL